MRKFTILMTLVALASFAMAQVQMDYSIQSMKNQVKKSDIATTKEAPIWEVTFEEETPVWTIGQVVGTKAWTVADTTSSTVTFVDGPGDEYDFDDELLPTGTVVTACWLYMGWRDLGEYSESGGNFAWIDGITDLFMGSVAAFESYIQFDGIDLTGVSNPKITFHQNYKVFNSDECHIDFSTDGGSTWESMRINEKVSLGGVNHYGEEYLEFIVSEYIANEANVSIRFRWLCADTDPDYGSGYGWQIDDIKIVDTPEADLNLKQCNMSYFSYGDYTDPAYSEYNVYQISGYYGNIPQSQLNSDFANAWFNIIVENKGVAVLTPQTKVEVFNPEMTSIFSNVVEGIELVTNAIDTVDLIETEFAMSSEMITGKYTVVYSVSADGVEDANPTDNADTAYFYITENFFSRDVEMPDNRHSLNNSSAGGNDTEKFGHTFTFLNNAEITSVDVFIDENTDAGTAFMLHAYHYNSGTSMWEELSASTLMFIEEENLGNWMNILFTDAFQIVVDPEVGSFEILVALEMYYNEVGEIWIGYDRYSYVDGPYNHAFYTQYIDEPDTWYYGGLDGGLSLRLNFNGHIISNSEMPIAERDINIYPNPTSSSLNIENVEGCNIQILNMMGQVVENIENANMVNSVDMSKYANGTYFVKVINGNEVSTHKVNLMK